MRARRVDANHGEIKRCFESLGCRVFDAYAVGKGFPDLVVQWGNAPTVVTRLVEVKIPKGKLTSAQKDFRLHGVIARSADDVAACVAQLRREHVILYLSGSAPGARAAIRSVPAIDRTATPS